MDARNPFILTIGPFALPVFMYGRDGAIGGDGRPQHVRPHPQSTGPLHIASGGCGRTALRVQDRLNDCDEAVDLVLGVVVVNSGPDEVGKGAGLGVQARRAGGRD